MLSYSPRYGLAQDDTSAFRMYREMISKGLQPDQRTMSNMIFAQSWGSVEDMRRLAVHVCMVTHIARVWINRLRLLILQWRSVPLLILSQLMKGSKGGVFLG